MRTPFDSRSDDRSLSTPRTRRDFLARAAAAGVALSLGCTNEVGRSLSPLASRNGGISLDHSGEPGSNESDHSLPDPAKSGIDHVVLVMMENRSFDHLLGWTPKSDGRQAGLSYTDAAGVSHPTHALAPDFQGCGYADPDHSYEGGRVEYDGGRCDGWLRAGSNDVYCIGYYQRADLPFFGRSVMDWTTSDRYFAAIMAETFPNRFYQHAAQTDRLHNTLTLSTLPTIWDRLAASGLTGRYYFSDLPFLALWGPKYASITQPITEFFAACATGALPQVSFIDPKFLGEDAGVSNDDHPHADIRAGESFLNSIYSAVTMGPAWARTLLVINFDEWGGFFDHVAPTAAPIPDADKVAGNQDGLRGFRTPVLVVSPFSRRGHVSHRLFDHTSVLRTIEWRWGLEPLTVRDETANNLAEALDFRHPLLHAPQYLVPPVVGAACPSPSTPAIATRVSPWAALGDVARAHGLTGA